MKKRKVLVVGSAEKSHGGVTSVIKIIKKMPVWSEYECYWLGTQIQSTKWVKLFYAVKANIIALFIVWRYDIVHFHMVHDKNCLLIQMPIFLLAKAFGKKTICHLHEGNQLEKAANSKLFNWWLHKSDLIVLLAQTFRNKFSLWYPSVKTKTAVVYNACESVNSLPYDKHQKYILFAGIFRPNKDGCTLIRAFARIHKDFPDWKVYLLGDGPEKPKFDELVNKEGISDKVIMPGHLTGEELAEKFRKAGIYCLCSHHEGFPMVVLESWQYGVPVVTTLVGGLPDVVEEGKNALTFSFGDDIALARQLSELMRNDNLRENMALYSQEFSLREFSVDSVNETIRSIYNNI